MSEYQKRAVDAHKDAIAEAERFLKKARAALKDISEQHPLCGTPTTAAAKRSSMDLTRALAQLRRSPWRDL